MKEVNIKTSMMPTDNSKEDFLGCYVSIFSSLPIKCSLSVSLKFNSKTKSMKVRPVIIQA
jgi:hypothetical protein